MQKIDITVDVNKLTRSRIHERKYTNKDGKEVTVKEIKLTVVPLNDKKFITKGDGWELYKTHFVAETATKEERENKAKTAIVGDGIQFISTNGSDDTADAISGNIPF
jgi:hypothetical protein